jgi:hypothetical protein
MVDVEAAPREEVEVIVAFLRSRRGSRITCNMHITPSLIDRYDAVIGRRIVSSMCAHPLARRCSNRVLDGTHGCLVSSCSYGWLAHCTRKRYQSEAADMRDKMQWVRRLVIILFLCGGEFVRSGRKGRKGGGVSQPSIFARWIYCYLLRLGDHCCD